MADVPESLIPKHGGYRKLKSFQVAELVYDVTVRFCNRYIDKRSRTNDQMGKCGKCGILPIFPGDVKERRGFAARSQFPCSSFQLKESANDALSDRDLRGQRCTNTAESTSTAVSREP